MEDGGTKKLQTENFQKRRPHQPGGMSTLSSRDNGHSTQYNLGEGRRQKSYQPTYLPHDQRNTSQSKHQPPRHYYNQNESQWNPSPVSSQYLHRGY